MMIFIKMSQLFPVQNLIQLLIYNQGYIENLSKIIIQVCYNTNFKMNEPKILVAVRKRPLSKKEEGKGENDIISVKNHQTMIISEYKQKVDLTKYLEETVFNFDFAFNQETTNQDIYNMAICSLVDSAFQGAKVTCFAYGQTGSGKTFTMNGNEKMGVTGLYALGAHDIFAYLADPRFQHLKAKLSYFEIYCGKLYDLLNKRTELKIRQDNKSNINIIGLEQTSLNNFQEFQQYMKLGGSQRITSQNSANAQSSRSHAILQIILKEGKKVFGKISFIDLAGNQRGADHTDMKKQTRIDGAQINKSLLSLKQCIRALDQGKGHVPFRGSKLTMVLKDSFVGFCRTVMIGNVSPSSASSQNTLNTLRYADRVKQLRKPAEGVSKQELKARQMMLPRQNKNAIRIQITKDDDAQDIELKRVQAQKDYGIKEEAPREMSEQPNRRHEQSRNRQQSFGGGMRGPSRPIGQKQTVPQQKQPLRQPGSSNKLTTINMGNQKKSPIGVKQNQGQNNSSNYYTQNNSGIQRSNSMQLNQPRGLYQNNHEQQFTNNNSGVIQGRRINGNSNLGNYSQDQYHEPMQNNFFNNNNQNNQGPYNNSSGLYNNESQRINQYKSNYQYQANPRDQKSNSSRPNNEYQQGYNQNVGGYGQARMQLNSARQQNMRPPIPKDWDGMVNLLNNVDDPSFQAEIKSNLHQKLFNQENQLMASHSENLKSSLEIIRSEMTLMTSLQSNRDSVSTREYLSLMQQSIDEKISQLQMLRQKMVQFTYKLDTVEEMQNQGQMEGQNYGNRFEDQQLLNDLH